jgi:hypothetical protein
MPAVTKKRPAKIPAGRPVGTHMPDSLVSRLCQLDVGKSESKAVRLNLAEATTAEIGTLKENLGSTVRSAMHRALERVDAKFEIETGDFRTANDCVIVSAVITRTA